jgi:ABC-type multidrug transport system ATPase subunit
VAHQRGGILTGVSKRFNRKSPWVMREVDLTLAQGSCTVIVGGNGSGKSTLARLAVGLTKPNAGSVVTPAAVGYVPERLAARSRLTGTEYLAHMGRIRGLAGRTFAARANELLERLDLQPGPSVPSDSLSKGNRQKLVIAQAFVGPVNLLVLDEPYGGLDVTSHRALDELIGEAMALGTSVLLTAHRPDAAPTADRVLTLEHGNLAGLREPDAARRARPEAKRMELTGPGGAGAEAPLTRLRGVRSCRVDAAGRAATLIVGAGECDGVLRAVMQLGWSVSTLIDLDAGDDRPDGPT